MARKPTGQVIERRGKRGVSFGLRFRALNRRWYITANARTHAEADEELANLLADVRRGIWRPPQPEPVDETPAQEPTFHVFASEWLAARELEGLAAKTISDLRWSLVNHLLPFFAGHRLSEITPQEVDRYKVGKARERQELDEARTRGEKVRERGLSNNSVNHTLSDLAQVLETAVEYGLLAQNPASGKRRRLKSTRPARPWVEPEQLPALLDSASQGVARVLLALLAGAGLRIGEALALRWSHVDLATGTLYVVDSKTAAGVRAVDLTPALREVLILWRAESRFTARLRPDHVDRQEAQPLEPPPRCPAAGDRGGERRARTGRHRRYRPDHLPLAPAHVREPSLRLRRRRRLHVGADRARGCPLHASRLHERDQAPRAAVRAAPARLRSGDRMGTNGH